MDDDRDDDLAKPNSKVMKPTESTQLDYLDEKDDLDGDDNDDEDNYQMPKEVMQLVHKRMEETSKEKERGGFD